MGLYDVFHTCTRSVKTSVKTTDCKTIKPTNQENKLFSSAHTSKDFFYNRNTK